MGSKQFVDANGHPVPLFLQTDDTINVTIGATQNRSAQLDDETQVVEVYCTSDAFFRVGDVTVVAAAADSRPITANVATLVRVQGGDYISVIQQSAGGTCYITPLG